jgi:inner membrane protein
MAPDLDVLIRSSTDPLLFLEYHRQFTHSLIFIPFGALLCAWVFHPFVKSQLRFYEVWLFALLGYGTHGVLDACTTYGTLLLWPFSELRIAWNTISVIDPLFTVPVLALVILASRRQSRCYGRAALGWAVCYLLFGTLQHHRAEEIGYQLAASRGHQPDRLASKPGFGNLFLWKIVYEYQGRFYVDAVRTGLTPKVYHGDSVVKLDASVHLPWLAEHSQQAIDLARFNWFSNDYLALDTANPYLIVDMRYSMLPNEINGLWGIELDPNATDDDHVGYRAQRNASPDRLNALLDMLFD